MISVHDITNSIFTSKTYILFKEEEKKAWLVDIGDIEPVLEFLHQNSLSVEGVFLTHGHFDHILGVNGFLKNHPEAKVVIHREDEAFLTDPVLSHTFKHGLTQEPIKADIIVEDG
ncbi:MAG: MBL fold metallo-hydrolase, partial [Bacteroidaceae bacterium]|nr:MBL fold metallo-hydrolase [Bacteroidaceae bacterium]